MRASSRQAPAPQKFFPRYVLEVYVLPSVAKLNVKMWKLLRLQTGNEFAGTLNRNDMVLCTTKRNSPFSFMTALL